MVHNWGIIRSPAPTARPAPPGPIHASPRKRGAPVRERWATWAARLSREGVLLQEFKPLDLGSREAWREIAGERPAVGPVTVVGSAGRQARPGLMERNPTYSSRTEWRAGLTAHFRYIQLEVCFQNTTSLSTGRYSTVSQFQDVALSSANQMKTKDLTPDQILAVHCQTCGAQPGEPCQLHSGGLRNEPHRNRKLSAADVEAPSPEARLPFCEICRSLMHERYTSLSRYTAAVTRLKEPTCVRKSAVFNDAKTLARRAGEACKEARVKLAHHRLTHSC